MAADGTITSDVEAEDSGSGRSARKARGRLQVSQWLRWSGLALLVTLYMALWAATGSLDINPTDFDVFFLPSARVALAGHPLLIYSVRYMGVYPNANGPLSMLPLTLVAAVAQQLSWLSDVYLRRMLVMAVFSLFALLMSREALLAVERFVARPLATYQRLCVFAFFALSPELWHAMLLYGHIELPLLIALVLAAVRLLVRRRMLAAGALLGLALLTRSMAVLYIIPLMVLLLREARWRDTAIVAGTAVAVAGMGILPFWLADRADVLYSLVTFRVSLPVGGGSFWELLRGTPLFAFGMEHDSLVAVALALLLCVAIVLRRRDITVSSREVYGLLALCGFCFPIAIKTIWPYYFLDGYVLLGIWWLTGLGGAQRARAGRTRLRWWLGALLPLATVGAGALGEYGVSSAGYGMWSLSATAFMSTATTVLILAIGTWMWVRKHGTMHRGAQGYPRIDRSVEL